MQPQPLGFLAKKKKVDAATEGVSRLPYGYEHGYEVKGSEHVHKQAKVLP